MKNLPSGKFYSGLFRPQNPEKYQGDPTNIVYRSRPELVLMSRFDTDPRVLQWGSETTIIPYRCKTDGKIHRYVVDFSVLFQRKDGSKIKVLIEYKPKDQTVPPKRRPKQTDKSFLFEVARFAKNASKWEAAQRYAASRGFQFKIYTESDIGLDAERPPKLPRIKRN